VARPSDDGPQSSSRRPDLVPYRVLGRRAGGDHPRRGRLLRGARRWSDLSGLAGAAITLGECLGGTVTIYNPDLDPERRHAREVVELIAVLAEGLEAQAKA
jgi:hypothetical protein